jgi:hypothetical protein
MSVQPVLLVNFFSCLGVTLGVGVNESNDSRFCDGSLTFCCELCTLVLEKVSLSRCTRRGISRRGSALLIALRLKVLPTLPLTTKGSFLARIDVAACSREEPHPKLKPDTTMSGFRVNIAIKKHLVSRKTCMRSILGVNALKKVLRPKISSHCGGQNSKKTYLQLERSS